jgi:hypothetical protein
MFKTVEFMDADEKMRVFVAWKRFINSGCKYTQFTKGLYNHLILHCGFIAHYNRAEFYNLYFNSKSESSRFFAQFDRNMGCKPAEGYWVLQGGNDVTQGYHDINNAMVDYFTYQKGV